MIDLVNLIFNLNLQFYGRWIEVEKTPSVFDFIMRCLEIDYLASENGNSDGTNLNVVVRGTSL